jgi:rod shape-determining protein MreC
MALASIDKHSSPRTPALGLRFLFLASLSILLLVVDHQNDYLTGTRKAVGAAVYPLRVVVDAPISLWRWASEATASRNELALQNSRLNAERLLTNARLQRYTALEAENARLRSMLEATTRVRDQVRVAEIMSVSSNPFRHVLVIDKGTRSGVYDGQALVDADGVVGQVIEAGLLSSQGLLISDPDHALPVEVNRNGLRTIAVGTGEYDRMDLPSLPNNADVNVGDLLVTSGLGGAFPAGYPVAIVDSVTRIPQEPFALVTARPVAALNQVREIMLIWSGETEGGTEADETRTTDTAEAEELPGASQESQTQEMGDE